MTRILSLCALGALIAVSISGKVKESILPGVAVGDELTVSFLAEPTARTQAANAR